MSKIASAAATGLPAAIPSSAHATPRRRFLAGLATLPLIGGSVALVGRPRAVAEPVTPALIEAYKTWLSTEHNALTWDMAADPVFVQQYRNCYAADADHETRRKWIKSYEWFVGDSHHDHDDPYKRAALVMSAVGCDWRDHEGAFNFGSA